jgi:type IV secretion system protein TrbI
VTENVHDSPTGRFLLIPQGARLIGIYDSQIAFGQSRVLLVWTRLIMPNGRSIVLERQSGADTAGYAGLEDEVDNHWGALFKAALLSTLLGVGSELGSTSGTSNNSDIIQALRRGSSDSLNQTGQQAVRRNLNIQPTSRFDLDFRCAWSSTVTSFSNLTKVRETTWRSSSSVPSPMTSR